MTPRTWIWAAVTVQLLGTVFDFGWHALNRDFKAETVGEMVAHLTTVHLPIYIGVVSVLLTTAWALLEQMRRSKTGLALPVTFAGALVATAGEAWHAYSHLQLTTHSGPIAAATAYFGLMVVIAALWLERRQGRRRAAGELDGRRTA
jgi:uncharacterized membrane protein